MLHRRISLGLVVSALLLVSACGGARDKATESGDAGAPRQGGTLHYALGADPPTLDIQQTTAGVVATVAYNVVEFLYVRDEAGANIPMLAEKAEPDGDSRTWTVSLRKGVTFHNGETMNSADVLASYERWAKISLMGAQVAKRLQSVKATDDSTLVFTFKEPFGAFLSAISINSQGLAIYPASVVKKSTDTKLAELVGTGPYKLDKHDPGRMIKLVRFDRYAALPGDGPRGYGGRKPQYLDAIEFTPVSNEGARLAGFEAGKYDLVHGSSADALLALEGSRKVVVEKVDPTGFQAMLINQKSPVTANEKLRKGIQAALDHNAILAAGLGQGNFRLDPSIQLKETQWHSEASKESYNVHDVAKAKQLIADSGYKGQPLRLVTSRDLVRFYNQAVVVEQQLKDVGLNVTIETYDWATALEHRDDPNGWELFITDFGVKNDPIEQPFMKLCAYVGWWCDAEAQRIVNELYEVGDQTRRIELTGRFQEKVYEQVPFIKFGDTGGVVAHSARTGGVTRQGGNSVLAWNVWLNRP
ncbi:ABC transporter substrate-binding protein [Nonomuraea africana]|uniref:Peptide/nickel transport system substrate-binding protein n=1 Tax=Nonomuraea africana TaxID=46171 RepID=A0ABR9K6E1_9ACTN|nr:ABC transporter substrate-binding protein [Nonomuraea africana]MBE1557587.1 peptide/nickel transport system substrate-binding protein [Nonomuraea africana]